MRTRLVAVQTILFAFALPAVASAAPRVVVRTDLAPLTTTLATTQTPLIAFGVLSDLHQGDEELTLPSRTNWRTWAAVAPQMLNVQVEAVDDIAARGSPRLGRPLSMVLTLGDQSDNGQRNETRMAIDILDGHQLVDPNSGRPGIDDRRAIFGDGTLRSPVQGQSIDDLANEPFFAKGLRYPDGRPIPWFSINGNHNTKVMGEVPATDAAWRRTADAWATGDRKIFALNARRMAELDRIRLGHIEEEPAFWSRMFSLARTDPASVGDVRTVEADPSRKMLTKEQWMRQFSTTTGLPKGHGLATTHLCPDVYPADARRTCYTFDRGPFRFIALDDNALSGATDGSIDRPQMRWLDHQLTAAKHRYVIVLTHHSTDGIHASHGEADGASLERLLLRHPNVIAHLSGHGHNNKVWLHTDGHHRRGYWEIATPSIIDTPNEGRTVEIARNSGGTLSIFSDPFAPAVGRDPSKIGWGRHDGTDETKHGGAMKIDENWLASAGLHESIKAPAGDRAGSPSDRRVELVVPDPLAPAPAVQRATLMHKRMAIPTGAVGLAAGTLLVLIGPDALRRRRFAATSARRVGSPKPNKGATPWRKRARTPS